MNKFSKAKKSNKREGEEKENGKISGCLCLFEEEKEWVSEEIPSWWGEEEGGESVVPVGAEVVVAADLEKMKLCYIRTDIIIVVKGKEVEKL